MKSKSPWRVAVDIREFKIGLEYEILVDNKFVGYVCLFNIGKCWIGTLSGGKFPNCQVTEKDKVIHRGDVADLIASRIDTQLKKGKNLDVKA